MAQPSNNLRERLLATLPQPEKLAAYREETASLLARHARALRSDRLIRNILYACAIALGPFLGGVLVPSLPAIWHLAPSSIRMFQILAVAMIFSGAIQEVRYRIYGSQVATLKEIKQVQLQILELQASLRKEQ